MSVARLDPWKKVRVRRMVTIICASCGERAQRMTFNPAQPPKYCTNECTPTGRPFEERFFAAMTPEPNSGCWLWLRHLTPTGYGHISLDGVKKPAHNAAYQFFVGSIGSDLEIDHLCRNRACVNPSHLEAVTHKDNVLRGVSPSALHAKKQTCKNGHPFVTVLVKGRTKRTCRLCNQIYLRAYRRRGALEA